ncbi:MAG TPA: mannitol-1-phosphate 5-dehydrogenase [Clostridiaceae bacterium]|nr:mannitol-1-phosphate 5-dehydrogenase [Clostridiaceae bacterium]
MDQKIVIIGAGQTGRGFIARLMKQSGQMFAFIDCNRELVDLLNRKKRYEISFYSAQKPVQIDGFAAFCTDDKQAVKVLSEADIVFTAVGEQNLDKLIPLIDKSLKERKNPNKMIIVTCENGTSPKSKLSMFENQVNLSESIIFCTTLAKAKNSLDILSQYIDYLPYDLEPLSTKLDFYGMVPVDDFSGLIHRKIYTYNCLSAAIAYPGYYKGYKNYADAANDKDILKITDSIAENLNLCISREFNVSSSEQEQFTLMALNKFRNTKIIDTIERNARDIKRKLGKNERMIMPVILMKKYNCSIKLMELVIACAIYYGCSKSSDKTNEKESLFKDLKQYLPLNIVDEIDQIYNQLIARRQLSDMISACIL